MAKKTVSDKPLPGFSAVAGIIDQWGGIRYVVSDEWRIHMHHVNAQRDEIAFVVPNFYIYEPWLCNGRDGWNYMPTLTARVDDYVRWWQMTRNDPQEANDYRVALYLMRHADEKTPVRSLHFADAP